MWVPRSEYVFQSIQITNTVQWYLSYRAPSLPCIFRLEILLGWVIMVSIQIDLSSTYLIPPKFNSRLYGPLVRPLSSSLNPRSRLSPSWLSAPLDPPTMNVILQLGRVNISGCLKTSEMVRKVGFLKSYLKKADGPRAKSYCWVPFWFHPAEKVA